MKDRHPGWLVFGIIAIIIAAIFALPIVVYCVVCQAIFIAAIFLLDLILPSAIVIAGFDLGTGFLSTGIGAAIGFFLLLGRWTIDIIKIKWVYIATNIVFFMVSIQVAFQQYSSNVHSFFNFFPTHPDFTSWLEQCCLGFLLVAVPLGLIAFHAINKAASEIYDVTPTSVAPNSAMPPAHTMIQTPRHKATDENPKSNDIAPKELKLSRKEQAIWDRIKAPGIE